jgi:hypothetical protein
MENGLIINFACTTISINSSVATSNWNLKGNTHIHIKNICESSCFRRPIGLEILTEKKHNQVRFCNISPFMNCRAFSNPERRKKALKGQCHEMNNFFEDQIKSVLSV